MIDRAALRALAETTDARPGWGADGVPTCIDTCPQHDGKRCRLLGIRAHEGLPCEPTVAVLVERLRRLESALRALIEAIECAAKHRTGNVCSDFQRSIDLSAARAVLGEEKPR